MLVLLIALALPAFALEPPTVTLCLPRAAAANATDASVASMAYVRPACLSAEDRDCKWELAWPTFPDCVWCLGPTRYPFVSAGACVTLTAPPDRKCGEVGSARFEWEAALAADASVELPSAHVVWRDADLRTCSEWLNPPATENGHGGRSDRDTRAQQIEHDADYVMRLCLYVALPVSLLYVFVLVGRRLCLYMCGRGFRYSGRYSYFSDDDYGDEAL